MKARTRHWPLAALLGGVAAFAVGCDSETTDPIGDTADPAAQTEDIDARYGGFNSSDEVAGFGDEYLLDEGDRPVEDDMENDPEVVALKNDPTVTAYAVRLTFGYLERDSSHVNTPVRWDGSAVVDTGAVVGRRTILFEPLQGDHVVWPRTNRRTIEWVATTTVHFDGLQFVVLDPTGEDGDGTLTIEMPLYAKSFSTSELVELDELVTVDEAGHQVRIQAREVLHPQDPERCRHGWLAGQWGHLDGDDRGNRPDGVLGRFRGHWTNDEGTVTGTLRGFYGRNRHGHRVLFGKLVTEDGRFVAFMRGTWGRGDHSPGHGGYRARLYDAERNAIGGTRGAWQRRDDGRGTFMGGWALFCVDDPDGDVDIDEGIFEPDTAQR